MLIRFFRSESDVGGPGGCKEKGESDVLVAVKKRVKVM